MYIQQGKEEGKVTSSYCEGMTVGEYLNTLDTSDLGYNAVGLMTESETLDVINAIRQNPELCELTIAATNIDNSPGGGGGESALFINEDTGEAIVTFMGTDYYEWKDDAVAAGPTDLTDGVSSIQQANALAWYEEIYAEYGLDDYYVTLTGHSKGGNKAQYITLLEQYGSVDRCLSVDGQGVSDEFFMEYADNIIARQHLIENVCVDYDYVNFFLNRIGDVSYYDAQSIDFLGFIENHAPNTFLQIDENGNVTMIPVSQQPWEIAELDQFVNSFLRTLDPDEKAQFLDGVGEMLEVVMNDTHDPMQSVLDTMLDPDNLDVTAKFLAYLSVYEEENPQLKAAIASMMDEYGMPNEGIEIFYKLVDMVQDPKLANFLEEIGDNAGDVPNWVYDALSDLIYNATGIRITDTQMLDFLEMLKKIQDEKENVEIGDGSDLTLPSNPDHPIDNLPSAEEIIGDFNTPISIIKDSITSVLYNIFASKEFDVVPQGMEKAKASIEEAHHNLLAARGKVPEKSGLGLLGLLIDKALERIEFEIRQESSECHELKECLGSINRLYLDNEATLGSM